MPDCFARGLCQEFSLGGLHRGQWLRAPPGVCFSNVATTRLSILPLVSPNVTVPNLPALGEVSNVICQEKGEQGAALAEDRPWFPDVVDVVCCSN